MPESILVVTTKIARVFSVPVPAFSPILLHLPSRTLPQCADAHAWVSSSPHSSCCAPTPTPKEFQPDPMAHSSGKEDLESPSSFKMAP